MSFIDKRLRSRAKSGITTFVVSAVIATSGTLAANASEIWNLANAYAANSLHGEGNAVFADALAKNSNGEITVTIHAGGSLGFDSADHFDAVSEGAVEIADTPGNFLGGVDSFMLLSSLPFLASTVDEAKVLMDLAMPEYVKMFESNDQKLLYASPWPASGFWAEMPVKSAADLKGVKIRTFDPNGTRTLQALGAAPIQLPWADVVPQLATGGISAVLTSAEGGVTQKFVEHTPYFTEINYAVPLNFVHMNKSLFDGLTPELQKAVIDAAKEAEDRNWAEVVSRTQKNYDQLEADGGTLVVGMSDEFIGELSSAGGAVLKDWLGNSGERGAAVIEAYRAN
jgi:TRAP-type C4-dicarboxylate transport system substrate-binding protein